MSETPILPTRRLTPQAADPLAVLGARPAEGHRTMAPCPADSWIRGCFPARFFTSACPANRKLEADTMKPGPVGPLPFFKSHHGNVSIQEKRETSHNRGWDGTFNGRTLAGAAADLLAALLSSICRRSDGFFELRRQGLEPRTR